MIYRKGSREGVTEGQVNTKDICDF